MSFKLVSFLHLFVLKAIMKPYHRRSSYSLYSSVYLPICHGIKLKSRTMKT